MKISIRHTTSYHFDRPVPYALQRLRLTPHDAPGQTVRNWSMSVRGGRCEAEYDDAHLNHVALVQADPGVEAIHIECVGEVETDPAHNGVIGAHRGYAPLWLFRQPTALTEAGPEVARLVSRAKALGAENALELLHGLSGLILETVDYVAGATTAATTAEEAAAQGQGVCQDHAHIFIAAARALGFPARYVSGYLFMDGQPDQEAGHGWAEAHVDALGWVGFDVSNGISPDERYVRIATGRDYADAAPVHAMSFGAADHSMIVSLRVDQ